MKSRARPTSWIVFCLHWAHTRGLANATRLMNTRQLIMFSYPNYRDATSDRFVHPGLRQRRPRWARWTANLLLLWGFASRQLVGPDAPDDNLEESGIAQIPELLIRLPRAP